MGGAVVWAGLAVLARMRIARIGAIELLFLFAPLVIVPLGSEALTIPQMARTHGIFNAVGFCLPGLLGWIVSAK